VRIAVTGSIAIDHLMVYPGRFAEQLIAGQLDKVSLSFLADDLDIRRGGVAANIALALGRLGLSPLLVGAAGLDFAAYGCWLRSNGVDTESVRVSETRRTARFVCTTDADQNQIATFYAGAMAEAKEIELEPTVQRAGGLDLVVIAPNDPEAMLRHTDECRSQGYAFAADPSQQLARTSGDEARRLVEGARYLFTNAYEAAMLREHTGWSDGDVLDRVGTWITTDGAEGVRVRAKGRPTLEIPAVPTSGVVDPTGGGDALRAGFLAGLAWGLGHERAAQLGCALATVVLESVGTQEYQLSADDLVSRLDKGYGGEAAQELEPHLAGLA